MGISNFLDKIGGAGVKIKKSPVEKLKTMEPVAMQRHCPACNAELERWETSCACCDVKRLKEDILREQQIPELIFPERGGCYDCGSHDIKIDTVNGTKTCRTCEEFDKMWNEAEIFIDTEATLYDEGYDDGYAAMPPAHDYDEEYMMGYRDGEGDAVMQANQINAAAMSEPKPQYNEECKHKMIPYFNTDSRIAYRCIDCGLDKKL